MRRTGRWLLTALGASVACRREAPPERTSRVDETAAAPPVAVTAEGRPTMPRPPSAPGGLDVEVPLAATPEYIATMRFAMSLTLQMEDTAVLNRVAGTLQDQIALCAGQSAARHEEVPTAVRVQYSTSGRRFTEATARGLVPRTMASCVSQAFLPVALPADVNGEGSVTVLLRTK